MIYRFDAALVFFNADYFKERVTTVVAAADSPRWFLLDAEAMSIVDTTGAAILEEVRREPCRAWHRDGHLPRAAARFTRSCGVLASRIVLVRIISTRRSGQGWTQS